MIRVGALEPHKVELFMTVTMCLKMPESAVVSKERVLMVYSLLTTLVL